MTTLEHLRTAARPLPRLNVAPKLLSLMCFRCDRAFKTTQLARECPPCATAGIKTYGTAHPACEMSGM